MKLKELFADHIIQMQQQHERLEAAIKAGKYKDVSPLIQFEIQQTYQALNQLFNQLDESEATLETIQPFLKFFNDRWERIKNTSLSYTASPNFGLTKLCLDLATSLSNMTGKSAYELMMPTIQITESPLTGTALSDSDLKLHHFVLNDDHTHFIEVAAALEA